MKKGRILLTIPLLIGMVSLWIGCQSEKLSDNQMYSGSASCIECHARFYELWAPSHHGLAMQGVDSAFIASQLTFDQASAEIQEGIFTAVSRNDSLILIEKTGSEEKEYPAIHALGGKYIYYFLTPFEKGRLQVLPLAYDVKKNQWYNNPASAVRHFVDPVEDEALDWRSFAYTFNTSCHGCHVSQLENNYDLESGNYLTTWKEAGINCETCHGPSQEHVEVCRQAKEGEVPDDLKLVVTSTFTHEQNNSACAPCHAKMRSLTLSYPPGEPFYDHFDLVTLEDPDFYPDGRDLGENYTMTTWEQSACVQSGNLDCIHCHTSSGRYRYATENQNGACMPCHEDNVNNIWEHSHHPEGSDGLTCISCHMPKTTFARMDRSDHSIRPPMPAASEAFGSPNACNLCHQEESILWANQWVTDWKGEQYQAETLRNGRLLLDARTGKWEYLDELLGALYRNEFDAVYTTSFIRLLGTLNDDRKWPAVLVHARHSSPLVRAAAVNAIGQIPSVETKQMIMDATRDRFRVVRRAAAASIASFPQEAFSEAEKDRLAPLMKEYEEAFMARPDDWAAHYNLGNYYQNQQRLEDAVESYQQAINLFPEAIAPLINQSFAYNLLGKKELALHRLYRALEIDPTNEAANLNFAMLMGEMGRLEEAETALRQVAKGNPQSAQAAYNLSVILSERKPAEALEWSKKAAELDPFHPKYIYSYAYFLNASGDTKNARSLLQQAIGNFPTHTDSYLLLGSLYESDNQTDKARTIYQKALRQEGLSEEDHQKIQQKMQSLTTRENNNE